MNLPPTQPDTGVSNLVQKSIQNIGNAAANVRDTISGAVTGFNQPAAPTDFNYSNTIIAKVAFLILVIIAFLFLLNLGINLIGYFTSFSTNPYLVSGMLDGNAAAIIPQDPTNTNSVYLKRSNNETTGSEFTWSVWLYLTDIPTDSSFHPIFNKGDKTFDKNNLAMNNAPGLYYGYPSRASGEGNNILTVVMDVESTSDNNNQNQSIKLPIKDIPLQKWVNVMIRLENTLLDIYVNGTISARTTLTSVPRQNYYDVNVCQSSGFPGKLSDLRYFSRALNVFDIQTIVSKGPNTNSSDLSPTSKNIFNYLSNLWYYKRL